MGIALLNLLAALYLAGSGINSQTTYSAASGFHGSMFFTLSLPVSRRRLFRARAGFGAMECCIFVLMTTAFIPLVHADVSFLQLLRYGARAMVCTLAVYALSAFLACFLDEMWQFTAGCMILGGVWLLQSKFAAISYVSPLRGVSLFGSSLSAATPWAPVLASLALIAAFFFASVRVLERKEY
jgi:hypothetical protein